MSDQPRNWRRVIVPLAPVLVLAGVVSRRDGHLSWPATILILVAIIAATALYWRFITHKVLPSLKRRPRTWQTRGGHLKVTVRCKSCGNATEMTSGQGAACPSCGEEIGHTS